MRDFWRNVSWGWVLMGSALGALSIVGFATRLLDMDLAGIPGLILHQYRAVVALAFGELELLIHIRVGEPLRHLFVFWAVTSSNTARFFHLYKRNLDQTFQDEVVYFDETPGGHTVYGPPMKYPFYLRSRSVAILLGPLLYVLVLFETVKTGGDRRGYEHFTSHYHETYEVGPEFVRHVASLTRRLWYMLIATILGAVLFLAWSELSRVPSA